MNPIIMQVVVWAIIIAVCTLICIFGKKLPYKLTRAIKISLVFAFSANLLTNLLRGTQINNNVATLTGHTEPILFMVGICLGLALITYLIVYLVKDEELQRKIFFGIAITIFAATMMFWAIEFVHLTKSFPAHLCRQVAYLLPVIYFMKKGRQYTLPFITLAAFIGGVSTIFFNFGIYKIDLLNYGILDQITVHALMIIFAVLMWKTGEVKHSLHHIWQFAIGMLICTVFALGQNYTDFLRSGDWGDAMYIKDIIAEGIAPTWAFILVVFAVAYSVILGGVYGKNIKKLFKKKVKPKEIEQKEP
ncbi:MAG: YwaF family protein [Firmicutes bacterium]|nr:YwaF family protein [Bacillota bacterium]